jgi:hypothetical protein
VKNAHAYRVNSLPELRSVIDWEYEKAACEFSCKARDVGLDSYVECLEESSHMCPFSIRYAHAYYCKNPARVRAVKQLGK